MKTVVLTSGGMDSATLLFECALTDGPDQVLALSVNYGQRHHRELVAAQQLAEYVDVRHEVVDLTDLRRLFTGTALTDEVEVPEGHYAAETMRATVVPMRNPTFLCVAVGLAWTTGAERVAAAVHAGDHFVYPDCRPEFVSAFDAMVQQAVGDFGRVHVYAPFVHISKADIVRRGHIAKVPWAKTWSCYKGGEVHCGRCGTCVERLLAFKEAGVLDPTVYADQDYASQVGA